MTKISKKFAVVLLAGFAAATVSANAEGRGASEIPTPTKIVIHGHRGSRATRPENTIPAFKFAIENGVDVLELDLSVTKDNVLVVSHSPYLVQSAKAAAAGKERTCKGPEFPAQTAVRQLTLEQVEQFDCGSVKLKDFPQQVAIPGTKVATFDQVLDLMAANPRIEANVETKSNPKHPELTPAPAEFVKMIVDAVNRHHIDHSRIILQSFDFRTLTEMRKIAPKIRLSALISKAPEGLEDQNKVFVSVHEATGAEIISPAFKMVTPENVAAAHKAGVQIVPWTPDNPEEWKAMADAHVDAVITDDPAGLYKWLKAQKPALH